MPREGRVGLEPVLLSLSVLILIISGLVSAPHPVNGVSGVSSGSITTTATGANYWIAASSARGAFQSGQSADLMLSGIGFNQTGGSLLFNHPTALSSDGTHLLVPDSHNNRVLIWNTPPTGNTQPSIVLGQQSFNTNNPGAGLNQMNWPGSVFAANGKVVVADTYNNRILVWNSFPTRSGQPADFAIYGTSTSNYLQDVQWPWGVWTDGTKMAVASTGAQNPPSKPGLVLLWNSFPAKANQSADLYLTASGDFGTPRSITSDGNHLIVGDHNPPLSLSSTQGNFYWNSWPTKSDQPFDYFTSSIHWKQGIFTSDGNLILISNVLEIWNSYPADASVPPATTVGHDATSPGGTGYSWVTGDGCGVAYAGGKLYVSLNNDNKVVAFNGIPTSQTQNPDFAVGATSVSASINTLLSNYIYTNPVPVTDGKSLWVSDDFDGMLYYYRNIPDQSNAYPDLYYNFTSVHFQPLQGVLYGNTFALVGFQTLYIWNSPPTGQQPDTTIQGQIGSISFQNLAGVAMDAKYFYLSDSRAGKIYVFSGVPNSSSAPVYALSFTNPGRLSSDGTYLAVGGGSGDSVAEPYGPPGPLIPTSFYTIANLSSSSQPKTISSITALNPQMLTLAQGAFIDPDLGFNRVNVWDSESQALAGTSPSATLGCTLGTSQCSQGQVGIDRLFWPAFSAYDGTFLWVGEYKFSGRLLRFSGPAPTGPQTFDLNYNGAGYSIPVSTSTSKISDLSFYPSNTTLRLKLTESHSSGSSTVTFPNSLLNGQVSRVTVDGAQEPYSVSAGVSTTSVQFGYSSGVHTVEISPTLTTTTSFASTTSTTSTTTSSTRITTTSATSSTPGGPPGRPNVTITPSNGPNETVVTISGTGLAPSHAYRYCYLSGSPPTPPNPLPSCPASSPTFDTLADGSIPSSPAVTLKVAGPPGEYTVEVSDTSSPFVVPYSFTITSTSTSVSSRSSSTTTSVSSNSSPPSTTTSSSAESSQTTTSTSSSATGSSTSRGNAGVPELPYQLAAVTVFAFLIVASYLLTKSRGPTRSRQRGGLRV